MNVSKSPWPARFALALWLLVAGLAGCSATASLAGAGASARRDPPAPPRVQDCGIVTVGSPTKYVCNGKVYTTFELAKLRLGQEKSR